MVLRRRKMPWNLTFRMFLTSMKRKIRLCNNSLKAERSSWLNSKRTTSLSRTLQTSRMTLSLTSSPGSEETWMTGSNNLALKLLSVKGLFSVSKTKRKVLLPLLKLKISKSKISRLNPLTKRLTWQTKLRNSSSSMINQWTISPKPRSTSKEKRLWRIKDSLSKSRELKSITIKWLSLSKDTRKDSSKRKRRPRRPLPRESPESNRRRRMSISNTNRREKPWKSSKRMFNSLSLNLKEKRQSNSKNMRTSRDNKRSLSRTMKLKTSSFKSRMSNLTRLYLKVNSESGSKLSTGNLNTMRWKDNMPTFKVSWKRKKHFGKANLNSLKSKRIKLKKTMKMLSNNSSKL